ncbi:MAG: peptidylprolyl isomerase [Candidatus Omnitrophica bacterium]|nr:peptidylprolyl isomerase [Candidatus Omnitrophota bacterium]MDD4013622.1 peptidylprolyl isomerase [Candidatus Omnitrophota bacterium]
MIKSFSGKVFAALMAGMLLFAAEDARSAETVDKVLVVVNEELVTQREFDRVFGPIKEAYEKNFEGEELAQRIEEARVGVLDQLVDAKLVVSLAKKNNVKIDDDELKKRIDTVKAYYPSEEDFLKALSDKGTNLTEFEREIKDQMLAQEYVNKEVSSKINVTPGEISELYEKNKDRLVAPVRVQLKGILVRKGEGIDTEAAKKKISDIETELQGGADFAAVAREKDEGPYAAEGGEIGFVVPGQMIPEIDQVVFKMSPGQTSPIIETAIGYHIFKVEDKQEARPMELSEVEEFLRMQIFRKKFEETLIKWIEEKKKNAFISYK